jgi:CRISPR-associated protein Cas6
MNLWQENTSDTAPQSVAAMTDVLFKIVCERLPVDHAQALSMAVTQAVPWLQQQPHAGVHPIHVAGSQNGWERPDMQSGAELILSRRTRLAIRIPSDMTDELIKTLSGKSLLVDGMELGIVSGTTREIKAAATLFSRYTWFSDIASAQEAAFVDAVVAQCQHIGFQPTKLLCGKSHHITTSRGQICTRSVLLADVPKDHSLHIQDSGLGELRTMGCGLVIPHKDTGSIQPLADE